MSENSKKFPMAFALVLFGIVGMVGGYFCILFNPAGTTLTFRDYTVPFRASVTAAIADRIKLEEKKQWDADSATYRLTLKNSAEIDKMPHVELQRRIDSIESKKNEPKVPAPNKSPEDLKDKIKPLIPLLKRDAASIDGMNDSTFRKEVVLNKILVKEGDWYTMMRDPNDSAIYNNKAILKAVYLLDTGAGPKILISFQVNPVSKGEYKNNKDFFVQYPDFALWVFISIFQFTLWCMAMPVFFNYSAQMKDRYKDESWALLIWSYVIALAVCMLFVWGFYLKVQDKFMIPHLLVMKDYLLRMKVYSVIGYATAIACFGGMLWTAVLIKGQKNVVVSKHKEAEGDTSAKAAVVVTTTEAPMSVPALTPEQIRIQSLKKDFNFFFTGAAVLLSVQVLWTGVLFHGINSMELFSLHKAFTGNLALDYDFMYLFGAAHTLLLFIFYVPAKLSFYSPGVADEIPATGAPGTIDWSGSFKTFGRGLLEIATATSPFLVSILQSLFK